MAKKKKRKVGRPSKYKGLSPKEQSIVAWDGGKRIGLGLGPLKSALAAEAERQDRTMVSVFRRAWERYMALPEDQR